MWAGGTGCDMAFFWREWGTMVFIMLVLQKNMDNVMFRVVHIYHMHSMPFRQPVTIHMV